MTAAMFDELTQQDARRHNAALLRPGTLLFLWPPGEAKWSGPPVIARVRKARRDVIETVDLADPAVERLHEVGEGDLVSPLKPRWTWEIAAPPERPAVINGVERVNGGALRLEDRIRLICGEDGATVRFGMRDGTSYSGVVGTVVIDDDSAREADWVELIGPCDARGRVRHWLRAADIVTVTCVG